MENDERLRLVLKKHPQILLAVLFGSLAKNAAGVDSDIDLAVSADRPLSAYEKMQLIMDLAETIGRPVDLRRCQRADPSPLPGLDCGPSR